MNNQETKQNLDKNIEDIFMVDLINNYMEFYKKKNNKKNICTLFDGINIDDPTSTNIQMEEFYSEMCKYNIHENKIYKYEEINLINIENELYGIFENGVPKFISQSFFSLLIELTNLKNEDKSEKINYDIIIIRDKRLI